MLRGYRGYKHSGEEKKNRHTEKAERFLLEKREKIGENGG